MSSKQSGKNGIAHAATREKGNGDNDESLGHGAS
jgi:hypothetical protein